MENSFYETITSRNLGLIDEEEQEKIRKSKVAICGLGGIGSPLSEMLLRLGVGNFNILDHGTFEPTNSNRQIYSYTDTDGLRKTDVTEQYFKKVNPDVMVKKFTKLTDENVEEFIKDANMVILAVDAMSPILLLSRAARKNSVPLIEGWALAFGNVRIFTDNTPTLEEVYNFPTVGRDVSDISEEEQQTLLYSSIFQVAESFGGIMRHYPERAVKKMQEKKVGTTLAPLVWLSSTMMAIEAMKIILGRGELALAPKFRVYDPFTFTSQLSK
ncbi:MAG: ThiF family adenylyltransferase [Bacteroidales bacterium]|nr:ThiF family adenylyltransferase [Bacteroidales bacterium]